MKLAGLAILPGNNEYDCFRACARFADPGSDVVIACAILDKLLWPGSPVLGLIGS